MTPLLTQNLKALGLWAFFRICCSTFSFLFNVGLRLILGYLTRITLIPCPYVPISVSLFNWFEIFKWIQDPSEYENFALFVIHDQALTWTKLKTSLASITWFLNILLFLCSQMEHTITTHIHFQILFLWLFKLDK